MGHQEGVLLNGLLPDGAGDVTRAVAKERWLKAEERTAELIDSIQPNSATEERRHGVANFVRGLIMKCFPCQVFMYGSVPLKTYLPDGDIDLTVMSENEKLKDTWAIKVRDALENEERRDNTEFHVKEVQYIQAEVKIIKCIVENIVVDISFYQVGGLCTLCFLEEIDHLINQNHLFKRSVILTKAWCYYESRILGAHHGLISTYALETLVLYVFHVFNNSFTGPLEVLYRFLEIFSNFDWDNYCVSLWGPVPINSLPDTTAEQPRKDGGELLLSKLFLNACSTVYAVFPGGHERQGKPLISKHFNVIDPLQTSNNLGRSVSKGNFFRIRSAFRLGAERLSVLNDCSKENVNDEVNQFFMNTWKRHDSGNRPDAHSPHLLPPQPLETVPLEESNNPKTTSSVKKKIENGGLQSNRDHQADGRHAVTASSQLHNTLNQPLQNVYMTNNSYMPYNSHIRGHGIQNSSRDYYPWERNISSNRNIQADVSQNSLPYNHSVNSHELAKFQFARTQSSPELTQSSGGGFSRGSRNRVVETWIKQNATPRPDYGNRRNNLDSKVSSAHMTRSSIEDPSSLSHSLSRQSLEAGADSDSLSNSNHEDTSFAATEEELASVSEVMEMRQEEQDLVNMMSSSMIHSFGGPVQLPMHLASHHLPLRYPPVLPSPSYAPRNMTGIVPTISSLEPSWGSNIQFAQGFQSSPSPHFFPNVGLNSNAIDTAESGIEDPAMTEVNPEEIWQHEQYSGSGREFDSTDGGFQMLHSDDEQQSYTGIDNYFPSTWGGEAGVSAAQSQYNSTRDCSLIGASVIQGQQKSTRPCRSIIQEYHPNSRQVYQSGWQFDGSSEDISGQEHASRDWVRLSNMSMDITQKTTGSASSSHVRSHQLLGHEPAQIVGPDSMVPTAPLLDGSPCPRVDNSRVVPFTFYPTGPPVPFLTMLPMYNAPSDTGNSEGRRSEIDRDEREDCSHTTTSNHSLDSTEGLDPSVAHMRSSASLNAVSEPSDEHTSDILHSDFACHWQNLQYGRFCQNTRNHGPLLYPSPVMVPPRYAQGHFSQDGLGRPLSSNLVTQTMGYGPHLSPFIPLGAGPNRHSGVFQHFGDEMPKYRGGTGTYLPNLKATDKQFSSTRNYRGNYSYNRNEPTERGGNWVSSKPRTAGRNQEQKQAEKQSLRPDSITATKNRAGRPGDSYLRETSVLHEAKSNPVGSSNLPQSSVNTAYGLYVPAAGSSSVDSSGRTNDQRATAYASTAKPLEFTSIGQVHLPSASGLLRPSSSNLLRGGYEQRHVAYREGSSRTPNQPSAPQVQS